MFKITFVVAVLGLVGAVGCSKKDDKGGASKGSAAAGDTKAGDTKAGATKPGGGDCLVGTWERDDAGTMKQMVFNADKTGADVKDVAKNERSNFTWSLKDDKTVHISYLKEGDSVGGEFDMPFDCAAGTFYTLYKKKP